MIARILRRQREEQLLRDRCEMWLRDLDLPDPFDLDAFCLRLEEQRGRPLHLHPWENGQQGDDLCGAWISRDGADHVYYSANTTPAHQRHIVTHELAHMICGHRLGLDTEAISRLMPGLDPEMVRRVLMLGRTSYTDRQEREAELLASLILKDADRDTGRRAAGPTAAPPSLDRLRDALGGRREAR